MAKVTVKKTVRRGSRGVVTNIPAKDKKEALEFIRRDMEKEGMTTTKLWATEYSLESALDEEPHIRYQIYFGDVIDRYVDQSAVFDFEKFFGIKREPNA